MRRFAFRVAFFASHPFADDPAEAAHFRYTWCVGGIAATLFVVEIFTGVALMFYYHMITIRKAGGTDGLASSSAPLIRVAKSHFGPIFPYVASRFYGIVQTSASDELARGRWIPATDATDRFYGVSVAMESKWVLDNRGGDEFAAW